MLGYGAQGRAQALNLRDSGAQLHIGQRPGPRFEQAVADGFAPLPLADAASKADLIIYALADEQIGHIHAEHIAPVLHAGQTLGFMHGFAIHYRTIAPPPNVDVVLVAPKAQARGVRSAFEAGSGVFGLIAIHQDASGTARNTALGWAAAIGLSRVGLLETTFADETETDLFGEQAVLCGGLSALIHAAFDTLVAAGYPEELAYFDCCHEIKLLADLIHTHGIAGMRTQISSTARFGDLTRGPRIVSDQVRAEMAAMLQEIRSGAFARELLADSAAGGTLARRLQSQGAEHPSEQVGRRIRQLVSPNAPTDS